LLASHVVDASARAHHVVGEFFTRPLAEQLIELLVASPRPGARALLRAMESCGDRRTACTVRERAHDVLVEPAPEWELAIGKGRVAFVQLKNYRLSGQGAVDTLYFDLAWPDETEAELALSFDQAGVDRFTYAAAGHSLCDLDRMLLIGNGMSAGTAHPLERAEARVAAGLRHDEALRRTGAQSALDGLRGLVRSVLAR
ncbi:MAG: hypothetical protein H0W09_04695, partial [Solirubrobacterales bacterium]|nr:hypothetical protein [Solirubrobacterales bacterium]